MKLLLPLSILFVVLSFCTGKISKLFSDEPKSTPTPEVAANKPAPSPPNSDMAGSAPEKIDDKELISRLTEIENDWKKAESKGNSNALGRILADEFTILEETGKKYNKSQWISETSGGDSSLLLWKIEDAKIESRTDDTAIMSFTITYKFSNDTPAKTRDIDKFVMRDDRWQVVSSQATTVK
jgi:hypothetical protein